MTYAFPQKITVPLLSYLGLGWIMALLTVALLILPITLLAQLFSGNPILIATSNSLTQHRIPITTLLYLIGIPFVVLIYSREKIVITDTHLTYKHKQGVFTLPISSINTASIKQGTLNSKNFPHNSINEGSRVHANIINPLSPALGFLGSASEIYTYIDLESNKVSFKSKNNTEDRTVKHVIIPLHNFRHGNTILTTLRQSGLTIKQPQKQEKKIQYTNKIQKAENSKMKKVNVFFWSLMLLVGSFYLAGQLILQKPIEPLAAIAVPGILFMLYKEMKS